MTDPRKISIHEIENLLEIRELLDELFEDAEFIPNEGGPSTCQFSQEILEELWDAVYEPGDYH